MLNTVKFINKLFHSSLSKYSALTFISIFVASCNSPELINKNLSNSLNRSAPILVDAQYNLDSFSFILRGSSTETISFNTSDSNVVAVQLYYSLNNGSTYTFINSVSPSSNTYNWAVPASTTTQGLVKAEFHKSSGSPVTRITAPFTIDATAPSVAVTSPNGAESWTQGQTRSITWTATDSTSMTGNTISLEYSTDNGSNWTSIATSEANDGSYSWTVPTVLSVNCLVRVSATDDAGNSASDSSDAVFTIAAPTTPVVSSIVRKDSNPTKATSVDFTVTFSESVTGVGTADFSLNSSGVTAPSITGVSAVSGSVYTVSVNTGSGSGTIRLDLTDDDSIINGSSTPLGGVGAQNFTSGETYTIDKTVPSIAVTAPNGSEFLKGGAAQNITWTTSDTGGAGLAANPISIEYSTDAGSNWTAVAGPIANSSPYSWTVPSVNTSQGRIRITSVDAAGNSASDASDANFTIDSTAPTVAVTAPNGGEFLKGGASYNITWTASDTNIATNPISIDVSSDGGSNWSSVATSEANDGTYSWTVPSVNSTTYRIRVTAVDKSGNTANDSSDANFTIDSTNPSVTVTSPNGGEYLRGGATHNITWMGVDTNISATGSISIDYSSDGGSNWSSVATGENNDGTYTWTVPSLNDNDIRVRVTATDQAGNTGSDASNANFTIDSTAPVITLTQPGPLKGSTATTIDWTLTETNTSSAQNFTVEYSTDNGSNWSSVGTTAATNGPHTNTAFSRAWTPGAWDNNQVMVRVTYADLAGNSTTATSAAFIVDSTAPVFTATRFVVNSGAASTSNSVVNVDFRATDPLVSSTASGISYYCFKVKTSGTPTAPTSADGCWSATTNGQSIILSNLPKFLGGISAGTYTVFGWLKDAAGNISTLTSAGAGTDATDKDSITYTPTDPPSVINTLAANTNSPSASPPPSTEVVANGSNTTVYIKWKATAQGTASLIANPINIYYSTDGIDFSNTVVTGIANTANTGCTVDGTTFNGCYTWTLPVGLYDQLFFVQVQAEDDNGQVGTGASNYMNTGQFTVVAGNIEYGVGGAGSAAMFYSTKNDQFVVLPNGDFYQIHLGVGLFRVKRSDGIYSLIAPTTGTYTGNGGAATSATLKDPVKMAADKDDNILIFDGDRILKIDTTTDIISTFIGGGISSSDTVADPLDLLMSTASSSDSTTRAKLPLYPLPNGDLIFKSEKYVDDSIADANGFRLRKYTASTGQVTTVTLTGNGYQSNTSYVWLSTDYLRGCTPIWSTSLSKITYYACSFGSRSAVFNADTGVSVAASGTLPAHSSGGGNWTHYSSNFSSSVAGQLYLISQYYFLDTYDYDTNSWTHILGNSSSGGDCTDGTTAATCNNTISSGYINRVGEVFWIERGILRSIDGDGKVITLYGQAFGSGHGQLATNARFSFSNQLAKTGANKFALQTTGNRLWEFTVNGNANVIAGTGATSPTPSDGDTAASSAFPSNFWGSTGMVADSTTGDIWTTSNNRILKLVRSTGLWSHFGGGLGANTYPANIGNTADNIHNGGGPRVVGYDGTNILVHTFYGGGTPYDRYVFNINISTKVQTVLLGVGGLSSSVADCTVGNTMTTCEAVGHPRRVEWDATHGAWIGGLQGGWRIGKYTPGGTFTSLYNTSNSVYGSDYARVNNTELAFFCRYNTDKVYGVNITTTGAETLLSTPIPGMSCKTTEFNNIVYDDATDNLYILFEKNGLYGVGRYSGAANAICGGACP